MPLHADDAELTSSIRISYQPVIRLADMHVDYAEVLARAAGANGTLGPETIIQAMTAPERSLGLTMSIMRRALAEFLLSPHEASGFSLAFNLPLDALLHPGLTDMIASVQRGAQVMPGRISLELTETHPVLDLEAARTVISVLRRAGYQLALDDVGPGTANLSALMAMPVRAIKFDHKLVGSGASADRAFICRTTAQARAAGLNVIAEGIETSATLTAMTQAGVTHGQGFLFARPLPAAGLAAFLQTPRLEMF